MNTPLCNKRPSFNKRSSFNKRYWAVVFSVVLACLSLPAVAAQGDLGLKDLATPKGQSGFVSSSGISMEKATSIARRNTGGRVLSASPQKRKAGTSYKVRMLVDGERVVTVTVDHQGRIKGKR